MRWPEAARAGVVAVGWAWLLLPLAANASGAHMVPAMALGEQGDATALMVTALVAESSSAMDCPPCVSCYMGPAPAVKPPAETDRPSTAAWVHPTGARRDADGWHVLEALPPGVPLRIAFCRWRD